MPRQANEISIELVDVGQTAASAVAPSTPSAGLESEAGKPSSSMLSMASLPIPDMPYGAICNFVNSIIGAGIIGLPFALREAGLLAGILLLLATAVASNYSSTLIVNLGVKQKQPDYESLAKHVFGQTGFVLISLANFLFAFGAMIAYLIIVGDTVSSVLTQLLDDDVSAWERRAIILSVAVAVILPLSLVKNMSTLAWSSSISIAAVIWIVLVVVARSFNDSGGARLPSDSEDSIVLLGSKFFPAIGIVAFAYVCQHNSFIVFKSLDTPTVKVWRKVSWTAIGVSTCACIVLSLAGYLTFRDLTRANLLNNYADNDFVMAVTRIFFSLTMVLTFPMELFVARHCLVTLFAPRTAPTATPTPGGMQDVSLHDEDSEENMESVEEGVSPVAVLDKGSAESEEGGVSTALPSAVDGGSSEDTSNCVHYSVSLLLWGAAVLIAMVVEDLGIVLELTGGVSATFLGFIMPAALGVKLSDTSICFWRDGSTRKGQAVRNLAPPVLLGVFGLLAMFTSTTETVRGVIG